MTGTAAGEAGRVQIIKDLRLLQPGLTSSERAWRAKKLFEAEKLKEQVSYNLGPKRWNLRPGGRGGKDQRPDERLSPAGNQIHTSAASRKHPGYRQRLRLLYSGCVREFRCYGLNVSLHQTNKKPQHQQAKKPLIC